MSESTLAVAYGINKTFIYFVAEELARKIGQDLLSGEGIVSILNKYGIPISNLTTNNANSAVAKEAEDYEVNCDYWFDIYDMNSIKEALE